MTQPNPGIDTSTRILARIDGFGLQHPVYATLLPQRVSSITDPIAIASLKSMPIAERIPQIRSRLGANLTDAQRDSQEFVDLCVQIADLIQVSQDQNGQHCAFPPSSFNHCSLCIL